MKKIIFILALFVSFVANSQKTTGSNYTYFNTRSEWFTGIFQALGLPSGSGPAAFKAGQDMRAGALYYDSVGVDSGLHVWTGAYWRNYATASYTDADARSAISLTTTGTSGAATYTSATGVFNIPVYAGTLNTNVGAFYRWLKPASQEIKTVADGYGIIWDSTSNTDALTAILDSATVFPHIRASIEPNLVVQSAGAGEPTWYTSGDTLYLKTINDAATESDSSLTIAAGSSYTFSTGLTEAAGTVTNNLSTGVSGGQTIIGGTASGNSLTYSSTSHATKGDHIWGTTSKMVFDEVNNELRIGSSTDLGLYGLQSSTPIVVGRAANTAISKFTFANNTTGSAAIAFFTSNETQIGTLRSSGPSIGTTVMGVTKNSSTELFGGNGPLFIYGLNQPVHISGNTTTPAISVITAGRVGIGGVIAPTASLHLPAGLSAASGAPLKFTSGTNLTTAEAGSMEFDGTHYYLSPSTTRKKIPLVDNSTATNGFFPIGNGTDFTLAAITEGQNINVTNGAGSITVAGPTLTKNATIENPTASENLGWFRTPVAITITNTHAVLVGGSPSVTYQISFGTDITSLTNVYSAGQTVTSETTGDAASGVNDATIPANSWVRITTSAATDVTQISLSITYTED